MTRDDELVLQGFTAAARGDWAGTNPYHELSDRIAWLEGFLSWHARPKDQPVETEIALEKFHVRILRRLAEIGADGCTPSFFKPV